MIYLLTAINLITLAMLAALYLTTQRQQISERARFAEREDQLLNRITNPQVAAAQSAAQLVGPPSRAYISAFDDDAMAEYEQSRNELALSTQQFVEAYDKSADQAAA